MEPHLASSSLPLHRHQKLVTDSPDEVYALMSRLYSEARMFLRRPRDRFQSRVHAASLGQVGLLYNANTPGYGVNLVMPERFFFLSLAIHGQMRHRLNGAEVLAEPGVAVVGSPGQLTTCEAVTGIETLWVTLDRVAVEQELARLLDRPVSAALEFAQAWSLGAPSGRTLTRLSRFLAEELNDLDDPQTQASLAVRQASRALLTLVLEGQPHNYTAALTEPALDASLRALRRVEECVEAHLSEPLTLGDLAAWGGVGVRTLQLLFQRHRGCTPSAFVRQRRLNAARCDLLAGGPDVSVTRVAFRWGFNHLGRFAAQYGREFGESPRDTLRRGLRSS
jgi:AraC-like DNA-binding protein